MAEIVGAELDTQASELVLQFEGGLNMSDVMRTQTPGGPHDIVIRRPRPAADRALTEAAIRDEYQQVGALDAGIDFELRSPKQQQAFMRRSRAAGLKTLECVARVGKELATDFVPGMALSDYVRQAPAAIDGQVIHRVLGHLSQAHSLGIVIGDRWVRNTIVTPDNDFVEIDFDIKLIGKTAVTSSFEVAQTLYHLLHFADDNRDLIADIIAQCYDDRPHLLAGYQQQTVEDLTLGQADFFYGQYRQAGKLYEGIVPPIAPVNDLLNAMNGTWKRLDNLPMTNSFTPLGALENS